MSGLTISAQALSALRSMTYSRSAASRICTNCLRPSPPFQRPQYLARRFQATATALHVQDMPTQSPPPRNAGIPETSIAGGQSSIDNLQSQTSSSQPQPSEISLTESEAQQTKPPSGPDSAIGSLATSTTPSTTSSARPARKSKLRPRKAAMTLTPSAVSQLRSLLDAPTPQLIRVGVKNRGCSGLAYHLEYVETPGTFDESVEQDGVKVLIDSKALFSIIGSEMDWAEDKLSRRFVFRNPNITEQCGCGESFSIG